MSLIAAAFCERPSQASHEVWPLVGSEAGLLAAPDGWWTTPSEPHASLALGLLATLPHATPANHLGHFPRTRVTVAFDGRLDNLADLKADLGINAFRCGDAETLAFAYRRWPETLASHLVGEFAFVLWDAQSSTFLAARDPAGQRCLFVTSPEAGTCLIASEPSQLLRHPKVSRAFDDDAIFDSFFWATRSNRRTHFRDIAQIPAGHQLFGGLRGFRTQRYWHPPTPRRPGRKPADLACEFRHRFSRAVQDRLVCAGPIALHLSGGLDSAGIVAESARVSSKDQRSRLHPISALFPGYDCDESALISDVLAQTGLNGHAWDGTQSAWSDLEQPCVAMPAGSSFLNGGSAGDLAVIREIDARVVLMGDGGNEVGGTFGLFSDYGRRRMWGPFAKATMAATTSPWISPQAGARDFVRALPIVAPLTRLFRRLRDAAHQVPPPPWTAPSLAARWGKQTVKEEDDDVFLASQMHKYLWDKTYGPGRAGAVLHQNGYSARNGFEFRSPYTDARLLSFVFEIPIEDRQPDGDARRLQRDAFANLLPKSVLRSPGVGFNSIIGHHAREAFRRYGSLLHDQSWHSERYVDRGRARRWAGEMMRRTVDGSVVDWAQLYAILSLEVWLRRVLRYHTVQGDMGMTTGKDPSKEPKERAAHSEYDPPRLIPIGNLHEVVAGGATTPNGDGLGMTGMSSG